MVDVDVDVEKESFVFFKVLLDDFKDKMILSEKFVAMSEGWTGLELRTALGDKKKVWSVEIRLDSSGGMFYYLAGDGWRSFVKDNDLQFGYFLVFVRCSGVTFYVLPFDHTGFRIDYNKPIDIKDSVITSIRDRLALVVDDDMPNVGQKVNEKKRNSGNKNLKLQKKPQFKKSLQSSYHEYGSIAWRNKIRRKKNMGVEKRLIVRKNPQFKIIMHPSYINNHSVNFPCGFRNANNLSTVNEATLTTTIGSWLVKIRHNSYKKRRTITSTFSTGWSSFVRQNAFKQGDVCIFELSLIDDNQANFYVTKEDSKEVEFSRGGGSSNVSERNTCREIVIVDDNIQKMEKKKNSAENDLKVQKRPQFKINKRPTNGGDGRGSSNVSERNICREIVIIDDDNIQKMEKKKNSGEKNLKVQKRTQFKINKRPTNGGDGRLKVQKMKKITVKKPQFKITMQPSYIKKRIMIFPKLFRDANDLRNTNEARLTTSIGNWTVRFCHSRLKSAMQSFFSAGWSSFCRENNLNLGDVCIFKLLSKKENRANFYVTIEGSNEVEFSRMGGNSNVFERNVRRKIEFTEDDSIQMNKKKNTAEKNLKVQKIPEFKKNMNTKPTNGDDDDGRLEVQKMKMMTVKKPQTKITIQPSYIRKRKMRFPCLFRDENDLTNTNEANLITTIGSWNVSFCHSQVKYGITSCLSGGWTSFCCGNNLKPGDVCIFELLSKQGNRAEFLVTKQVKFSMKEDNSTVSRRSITQKTRNSREITVDDKLKIEKKIKVQKQNNPRFKIHIQTSYQSYMNFPSEFRDSNDLSSIDVVTLKHKGHRWSVMFRHYLRTYLRSFFTLGWTTFTRENNLKPGDVCIFELLSKNANRANFLVTKEVIFSRREGNSSYVQLRNVNQSNYATESRSLLNRPLFEVKITNSHFNRKTAQVHIPISFCGYFHGVSKAILTNSLNESWEVEVFTDIRKNDIIYHRFTQGWKEFCHDNKLEEGDVCSFELISEEGAEKLELIVTFTTHMS